MNTLAELLSSRVKAEIFRLLFGPLTESYMFARLNEARASTMRPFGKSSSASPDWEWSSRGETGNRTYYHANTEHRSIPIFETVCLPKLI
jgi:hypothetical protein